jgi:hypothetical protein
MQAVILADRRGAELAPLCDTQCPALLEVADRPLLQYTIEDMAAAGVTEILLVVSDDAARIEECFGDGALWGVRIRYLLSRGEEAPQRLLARFGALLRPPFLAARGDVLRGAASARLLAVAASLEGPLVSAAVEGSPAALCLVREWPVLLPDLAWPHDGGPGAGQARVDLAGALHAPLDSLADLHRAALALAVARDGWPAPRGVEAAPGLRVGRLSQVDPRSRASGPVTVGAQSWVHRTARLAGPCVVGRDCYIDRGVQIRNSVVMPGSYVGEQLQVENAIVAGPHLIRVDLGICLAVDESKLLSSNGGDIAERLRQWPERALGAALLALSLPLWPLALLAALLTAPQAPLVRRRVLGNRRPSTGGDAPRRTVDAWQFATPVPVLRTLPLLWLVLRGDLLLFGARPRAAGSAPGLPRQDRPAAVATGLLGPALLYLPPDAPEEEVRLSELEFGADVRLPALLRRLGHALRLLFSARAWWPAQKPAGGA